MNFQPIKTVYTKIAPFALPVLILLFLFSLKTCQKYSGQVADYAKNLDSVARLAKSFQNSLGQSVAENVQIKVQSADELKKMTDTIFKLKAADAKHVAHVTEYARIIQEIKVKDKLATWDVPDQVNTAKRDAPGDTTFKPFPADSGRISVPRAFHYSDSTLAVAGLVTFQGVHFDSISIPNTVNFRILTKKTGFLGLGRTSTVQVLNSNSAVQTTGVTSIVVPPSLNWWQRVGKPVAFAVAAVVVYSFFHK